MTPIRCSLVNFIAVAFWVVFSQAVLLDLEPPSSVTCPSNCEDLFSKLKDGTQKVRMNLLAGKRGSQRNMSPPPTASIMR